MAILNRKRSFLLGLVMAGLIVTAATFSRPSRDYIRKALSIVGIEWEAVARPDDVYFGRFEHGIHTGLAQARFDHPVYSIENPNWIVSAGLEVEKVADGFTYPVNIVFADESLGERGPRFYVNELHGSIRYVEEDGSVGTLIDGLLNFDSVEKNDSSDEFGINGFCAIPGSRDLLITLPIRDEDSGEFLSAVRRLVVASDGRSVEEVQDVLIMRGSITSPSHQIQGLLPFADKSFLVSIGDAEDYKAAGNLEDWNGKIIRIRVDGSAYPGNPHYDERSKTAVHSYVHASGLRNAFGLASTENGEDVFVTDNGHNIDRMVKLFPGQDYGWDGFLESQRVNALFSWGPPAASPVGIQHIPDDLLGEANADKILVALFGLTGRGIQAFSINWETGLLNGAPTTILQHRREPEFGRATVLGLTVGEDGLYFSDFFGSDPKVEFSKKTGAIWRLHRSDSTLNAAKASLRPTAWEELSVRVKADYVMREELRCLSCHKVKGEGGDKGPSLDGVASRVKARLQSQDYMALLKEMDAAKPQGKEAEARARVRKAKGDHQAYAWFEQHLLNPKFDNPRSQMPNHDFDEEQLDLLCQLLLSFR